MKPIHILTCLLLLLIAQPSVCLAVPTIEHEPVHIVPRSRPLNIVARVHSPNDPVQQVVLHYAVSGSASPVSGDMTATGVGVYYATIPANYLTAKGVLRYYIEAFTAGGEREETRWFSVSVQDPGETQPATPGPVPEPERSRPGWFWPTVIVGGGALVVAGAVALSDSGGGGGDSTPPDPPEPPDNGNITDRVVTRTARGQGGNGLTFPVDTIIDASTEIGQRRISQIRVDLTLDPVDGFEESMQILYQNATVLETGLVFVETQRRVNLTGTSPLVVVRVVSSRPDDFGANTFSWTAVVTYFLEQ
jgi:hypothetical protein